MSLYASVGLISSSGRLLKVVAVRNGPSFGHRVREPKGTVRPIPAVRSPNAVTPRSFRLAVTYRCPGGGQATLPLRSPVAVAPVGLVNVVVPPESSTPVMNSTPCNCVMPAAL